MATVQDIVRAEFPLYSKTHGVRPAVRWAVRQLVRCRTSALGGHAECCPDGHYVRSHYNTCKHRACPQCGGLDRARWLERQASRFSLACDYHHVVFTIPRELHGLWRYNRSLIGDALFRAANASLQELLWDPRYLGALPGLVLTQHTWSRSLVEHVHIHVLVTAGGFTESGWRGCREGFFLRYKKLRRLYRAKVVGALRKALVRGTLAIPWGEDETGVDAELRRVEAREWHVRVSPRYRGGGEVLRYFSRYVRRGPVTNGQIVRYEGGEVRFRHRDHRTESTRTTGLTGGEFLRRLFEHVPEPGFRTVRYGGLFAPGNRAKLAACREWLGMRLYEEPSGLTVAAYLAQVGVEIVTHCPVCGRALLRAEFGREMGRSPPRSPDGYANVA